MIATEACPTRTDCALAAALYGSGLRRVIKKNVKRKVNVVKRWENGRRCPCTMFLEFLVEDSKC